MSDKDIRDILSIDSPLEKPQLKTISHHDLMNGYYEPIRWIIPDLLPEGLTVLSGAPKIGKSWLSLDLCRAVAFGTSCLNCKPIEQGDALYLALEDSERRLQQRFQMLQRPGTSKSLEVCTEIPRAQQGGLDLLND